MIGNKKIPRLSPLAPKLPFHSLGFMLQLHSSMLRQAGRPWTTRLTTKTHLTLDFDFLKGFVEKSFCQR
jgi:hypothetical protein